jgi:hypothetical protein
MMETVVRDPIEFLVGRKFDKAASSAGTPVSLSSARRARLNPELAQRIAAYKVELRNMPPQEFQALVQSEIEKQAAEAAAKADLEERQRFFNLPHAQADFEHWSRCAHWTLDEAIALSFGKAPEVVSWERLGPYAQFSLFAVQYARRRDLALRAVAWQQLYDPVLPGIFLAWARRNDIPMPQALEAAVRNRGVQVADWKSLYDELKEKTDGQLAAAQRRYDELAAQFSEHHAAWMKRSQEKSQKIQELAHRIAELEEQLASPAVPAAMEEQPSAATRERNSLLRLVIGMAVGGYGFDPASARSKTPAEIAADLERAAIPLDVDTVRKWLREGAELLPPSKTE